MCLSLDMKRISNSGERHCAVTTFRLRSLAFLEIAGEIETSGVKRPLCASKLLTSFRNIDAQFKKAIFGDTFCDKIFLFGQY